MPRDPQGEAAVFGGNRPFAQSNFGVRAAAFRHGLLLSAFEDPMEDMWDCCFLRFDAFPERHAYTTVEGRFRREDLGGCFQACDIAPAVAPDGALAFLLGVGSRLVRGTWAAPAGIVLAPAHRFPEPQQIACIAHTEDGVAVACSGGLLYTLAPDSLRVRSRVRLEHSSVRAILAHRGGVLAVLTHHDQILEVDMRRRAVGPHRIDLRPFKDPACGEFVVAAHGADDFFAVQPRARLVSRWSMRAPAAPAEAYLLPEPAVDISLHGGTLTIITHSP